MSAEQNLPLLVAAGPDGAIFEIPGLYMTAMSGDRVCVPRQCDLIAMPQGSDLFVLPGRVPIGYDPQTDQCIEVPNYQGIALTAVAVFMAPAHMQTFRASYATMPQAPRLPMYSYAAAGWQHGRFYVCGVRTDPDTRQDCRFFDNDLIRANAKKLAVKHRTNRLWVHLMRNCVLKYMCPAARNLAMGRWEAPLPVSRTCNAACLACISEQPCEHCVTAPQNRIDFVPTPQEVAELAVPHLDNAHRPVVSFGQGCEGEPLLYADILEESIKLIRRQTRQGVINLNTNGSLPQAVERLCEAGLDSIRVSLNSAQPRLYELYHRPKNYTFDDLVETLRIVRRYGRWASLNYFIFPGLTDTEAEFDALSKLIDLTKVNMIQTRNLNMDPEWYIAALGLATAAEPTGMVEWVAAIRTRFPWIRLGYFNPPRSVMRSCHYAP